MDDEKPSGGAHPGLRPMPPEFEAIGRQVMLNLAIKLGRRGEGEDGRGGAEVAAQLAKMAADVTREPASDVVALINSDYDRWRADWEDLKSALGVDEAVAAEVRKMSGDVDGVEGEG